MTPLNKWLLGILMPWFLGGSFVLWYALACCYFKRTNKSSEVVVQTILQSSVNVLLIGLYTTVARKCFEILDCSVEDIPKLNMDPAVTCDDAFAMQIVGSIVFVVWCILPFMMLSVQLIRFKWKGKLSEHMEESASFRIMYGWAIAKFRADSKFAFLWEVLNAVIKLIMVFSSVVLLDDNRRIVHSGTIIFSLILHGLVWPYKNNGTIMVVIFCVVDLVGIFALDHFILQIVFIVLLTWAVLAALSVTVNNAQIALRKGELVGLTSRLRDFSFLERALLSPFLIVIWPLNKLLALVLSCLVRKSRSKTKVEQVMVEPVLTQEERQAQAAMAENLRQARTEFGAGSIEYKMLLDSVQSDSVASSQTLGENNRTSKTKVVPVPQKKRMLVISISDGPHKGKVIKEYSLTDAFEIFIGYNEECDIVLDQDQDISGTHASICWNWDDDDLLTFDDEESTNGSKVNGASVQAGNKIVLSSNDKIEVGESVLVVVMKNNTLPQTSSFEI